ncbi:hypothetical protein [Amphibiibacter pelophylacis]|uniref:Uncharacterized protein n=1 Tax=Amphibiibacter pelophylacis TaxID=1799477 RepID=A0ACC6P1A8_9BURK
MAMSSLDSIQSSPAAVKPSPGAAAVASGELAKLESQLSDWVHCSSSKTSAGKAKIAEITSHIDLIKAQMKKAEETKEAKELTSSVASVSNPPPSSQATGPELRFDGTGTWVDVQV